MSITVAIIAQGAMGAGVASRLAANGATVLTPLYSTTARVRRSTERCSVAPQVLAGEDMMLVGWSQRLQSRT